MFRGLLLLGSLWLTSTALAGPLSILERPIRFDDERLGLTLEYIRKHYGIEAKDARITPRAIVIHWTGTLGLEGTWRGFNRVRMRAARRYLVRGGLLNVSAHFLVGRDGRIYRLLPETTMGRHCIGLNYDSVGIENMGGPAHPLTEQQLLANEALVRHLVSKHPIRHLIGHHEWKRLENTPLFRERDATYRNAKADPGPRFMSRLRDRLRDLDLEPRVARREPRR
jgi:N-acetyl-anhydromuramyl-L-alanine amidase AmpD